MTYLNRHQEKICNQIVEYVFKSIDEVELWLKFFGFDVETTEQVTTVKSPFHHAVCGFHWEQLDYYTRGHELNFCFFAGAIYLPTTNLIEQKLKKLNKKKK